MTAMHEPKRIQLRRTKGWRKPEGAIVVARPSKWGNPFIVHTHSGRCEADAQTCPIWREDSTVYDYRETRALAVVAFRHMFQFPLSWDPEYPNVDEIREALAGRDLACWCPLDQPCHADVLLELVNP